MRNRIAPLFLGLLSLVPPSLAAQAPPCLPCGGVAVDSTDGVAAVVEALRVEPRVGPEERLYVAWPVALDGSADTSLATAVADAGGTPWLRLRFHSPAPLAEHLGRLEGELAAAVAVLRQAPESTHVQVEWRPEGQDAIAWGDYRFLLKRAAVAIDGVRQGVRVLVGPVAADPEVLEAFYDEEIPAYFEGLALEPPVGRHGGRPLQREEDASLHGALEALQRLDPGKPAVVFAAPRPPAPERALAVAARYAAAGAPVTFFALEPSPGREAPRAAVEPQSERLRETPATDAPLDASAGQTEVMGEASRDTVPDHAPGASDAPVAEPRAGGPGALVAVLKLLAREFAGDLSFDPHSSPQGALAGWSFVRGEDLGLRIVVAPRDTAPGPVEVRFPDPTLGSPERSRVDGTEPSPLFGMRRMPEGIALEVTDPAPAFVLRLARAGAGEIAGLEDVEAELEVSGEREIPVEEILRRLQAFEDAQGRRLDHYRALNTTHMRFQGTGAGQTVEATFAGPYFVDEEGKTDWVWRDFYVNGVRWRGKRIPEIPLVQPERAATQPLEITFTQDYRYRLRGTATVDGRDCWVVDFEPAGEGGDGRLYRGTVWIDRQIHSRVRVRAVQVGLQGDVISNEERLDYRPVDEAGQPAPWDEAAFILPLHSVSHQIFSVLNSSLAVESERELTELELNGDGFAAAREAAYESEATMVRDTDAGLRYLVEDEESGERVVQEDFDTNRLFLLGGVFYDDSLDFPLPLAGLNYLDFDFRDTGSQVNVLFAGALVDATLSDPDLFGSRFDAGVDLFALAVPTTDTFFRDDEEILAEEVEQLSPSLELRLGHPIGAFGKLRAGYQLTYRNFGRTDETGEEFRLPSDHLEHAVSLTARYNRAGYRVRADASLHRRSEWEDWGSPESPFDPDTEEFTRWGGGIAKDFNLSAFRRLSAEVEYAGGENLDRFSKYDFSLFSDMRVHGYQSGKVRAEEALATHLTYGFGVSEHLRLDLVGDAAWATDEAAGLERELLGGIGVAGSFMGPWQTLIQLDVGVPVAGPDDGFAAFIAILKLWK